MPRRGARVATAVFAGLIAAIAILTATGVLTGSLRGAADNGDGYRLYCGAGIRPATADGRSNWVGGNVVHFTRSTPCSDPMPTSALPILKAAAYGEHGTFSLSRLVWLYAALAAATTAAAAWAASGVRLYRPLAVLLPLAPLADPDLARFFLSTYSEPAGLLGTYAVLCGAVAAATTTSCCRTPRLVALVLLAGGGAVAATAKIGYVPVLVVAVLLCGITTVKLSRPRRTRRRRATAAAAGWIAALIACCAAAGPLHAAMPWQDRGYPDVNAHNVVFTMLLPEVGPNAAADVGLPPGAAKHAGLGYYGPNGQDLDPGSIPGWRSAIGDDPHGAQQAAWRALLVRPSALFAAIGVALQATRGDEIDYLPSAAAPVGAGGPLQIIDSPSMGKDTRWLQTWLGGMRAPWWSAVLAALGILAGVVGLRARSGMVATLTRVAGASGAGAVGMAIVAVAGDGYYEIAKHMWLGAYLLDVVALALVSLMIAAIISRRPAPRHRSALTEPRTLIGASHHG